MPVHICRCHFGIGEHLLELLPGERDLLHVDRHSWNLLSNVPVAGLLGWRVGNTSVSELVVASACVAVSLSVTRCVPWTVREGWCIPWTVREGWGCTNWTVVLCQLDCCLPQYTLAWLWTNQGCQLMQLWRHYLDSHTLYLPPYSSQLCVVHIEHGCQH